MAATGIERPWVSNAVDRGRFVARCTLAATLSYFFAASVHLPHPVWAPMSALIVSQESLKETRNSVLGRFVGTLLGLVVALAVNQLGILIGTSPTLQIAVAVAICATCAKERPSIRVCLWTAPLLLATTTAATPPEATALFRGCEVVIGAAVGGVLHFAEERLLVRVISALAACSGNARDAPADRCHRKAFGSDRAPRI